MKVLKKIGVVLGILLLLLLPLTLLVLAVLYFVLGSKEALQKYLPEGVKSKAFKKKVESIEP